MLRGCETIPLPPAPVPHSLFLLFYQVEIRHRPLLQPQSRTRSGWRCPQTYMVRLWQFPGCRHNHKSGPVAPLCANSRLCAARLLIHYIYGETKMTETVTEKLIRQYAGGKITWSAL